MGVQTNVTYIGDYQCEMVHGPSQAKIVTDLPVDNGGQGRMFSPTDLFASSLASCVLTIMAKVAERSEIPFKGTQMEVEKIMAENPRRIAELKIKLTFAPGVQEKDKKKLLACVKSCPVHQSLGPEVKVTLT